MCFTPDYVINEKQVLFSKEMRTEASRRVVEAHAKWDRENNCHSDGYIPNDNQMLGIIIEKATEYKEQNKHAADFIREILEYYDPNIQNGSKNSYIMNSGTNVNITISASDLK
jgi:hypothetical protein